MNTIDRRKQALLKSDLKGEVTWPAPKSPNHKRTSLLTVNNNCLVIIIRCVSVTFDLTFGYSINPYKKQLQLILTIYSLVEPLLPRKSALNTVNFPHDGGGAGDTRNLLFQAVMRNQDNTSLPNMNEWDLY